MTAARRCLDFLASLRVPEGPRAGKPLRLAPFQRSFVRGALKTSTSVGVLSIGRGNGKTALAAGIALAELLGHLERQPRREVLIAARSREQASVALGLAWALGQLMRSALADAVVLRDPANNMKLVKGRSIGRIDAAAAAVLAVAEGARLQARPAPKPAVLHFV